MADVTSILIPAVLTPHKEVYAYDMHKVFAFSATIADNGDRVQLWEITAEQRLFDACMAVSATLGAAATIKLQRDRAGVYTDITGATTAAGADTERMSAAPMDLEVGDKIVVLIGGGDVGAAADVTVDLLLQPK